MDTSCGVAKLSQTLSPAQVKSNVQSLSKSPHGSKKLRAQLKRTRKKKKFDHFDYSWVPCSVLLAQTSCPPQAAHPPTKSTQFKLRKHDDASIFSCPSEGQGKTQKGLSIMAADAGQATAAYPILEVMLSSCSGDPAHRHCRLQVQARLPESRWHQRSTL